jgi:3',5'-nucleoside bisphosphate phosphatase
VENGVTMLSITDHDTTAAYDTEIPVPATLKIIPGIEFSALWRNRTIHVLGLAIDPRFVLLQESIQRQRNARLERAGRIAERLRRTGIDDTLEGATRIAAGAAPGRVHFARYLVECGRVTTLRQAFRKYLGDGKTADVVNNWASLETVIGWIRGAGGIAILAHPARYRLTATRLSVLVGDFVDAGGEALEVICGNQKLDVTHGLERLCLEHDLLASCGSDFHQPGCSWAELGRFPPLPRTLSPVWQSWGDDHANHR